MPVLLSFVLSPGHRWFPSTADASHTGLESKCPRGCPAPAGEPGLGKLGACTRCPIAGPMVSAPEPKESVGVPGGSLSPGSEENREISCQKSQHCFFQTGCLFSSFSLTISAAVFHCCRWCAMQGWSSTFSLTFSLCGIFTFFNNPIYFATRDFPMSLYAIILDTKNIGQIFVQSP